MLCSMTDGRRRCSSRGADEGRIRIRRGPGRAASRSRRACGDPGRPRRVRAYADPGPARGRGQAVRRALRRPLADRHARGYAMKIPIWLSVPWFLVSLVAYARWGIFQFYGVETSSFQMIGLTAFLLVAGWTDWLSKEVKSAAPRGPVR